MNEKFKPCPFCGNEIERPILHTDIMGDYAIQCPYCYAWGPDSSTKFGAIENWNRRADE